MNNIELITKYSTKAFDLVYKQESVVSVLDTDSAMVEFTGAKTVRIGKMQLGGLHNYYRNNNAFGLGDTRVKGADQAPSGTAFAGAGDFGYVKSNARLTWEEFTLRQDRAAAFEVEYFDNEESGDKLVGLAVKETTRTVVVPEVDAYCLSTIADYALKDGKASGYSEKPIAALNSAFVYFENNEVPADDQVIFVSPDFMNALRNTTEVTKFLGQPDYDKGKDIKFEITRYQGRDLITVSPHRLRTGIVMGDEGYSWGAGSKKINFLAVAKSAVSHIVKYNAVKVIDGELNLASRGFDGYTIFARVYHDVFVPDNKRYAIYVNTVESGEQTYWATPVVEVNASKKITSISVEPADVLAWVVTSTDSSPAVGGVLSNYTIAKVGDTLSTTTKFYAINSEKRVLGETTVTIS